MVAATQIAFADQFKKGQLGLSDQDYYDRYVAPYARQKFAQASGEAAPMRRGAKLRQGQLVAAQFGGQPTSMGEAATETMAPTFRKAMREALQRAQVEADEFGAAKMKERGREVAKALETIGTVGQLEAGLLSAIPYVGPILGGATSAATAGFQGGIRGKRQQLNANPLRTVQFDEGMYSDDGSPRVSGGGGGLYDLYNLSFG